jgi:hypothetical protein
MQKLFWSSSLEHFIAYNCPLALTHIVLFFFFFFILFSSFCVSQLSITVTKCLKQSTYKKESFTLAHDFNFQSMTAWLCCFWACGGIICHGWNTWQRRPVHLTVARKQKEKGSGFQYTFKGFHHLPLESPAGDQALNTWTFGGHSRSKLYPLTSKTVRQNTIFFFFALLRIKPRILALFSFL